MDFGRWSDEASAYGVIRWLGVAVRGFTMTAGNGHRVDAIDLTREPDFSLGTITVRPSASEILADGNSQRVEPRVMQLLVALSQAAGSVVSRGSLMDRCWPNTYVTDEALTRAVGRVRQLARTAPGAFEVETIPKIGYRLTAGQPDGAGNTARQPALRGPSTRIRDSRMTIVLLAAVTLVAATAVYFLRHQTPSQAMAVPADQTAPIPTIDANVHDRYLRAGGLLEAGGKDNLLRAEQLLREAIDLEPRFHLARERLATVLYSAATFMPERAGDIYAEVGKILEGQSAETPLAWRGIVMLGFQRIFAGDWHAAHNHLARARSVAPDSATNTVDALEIFLYGSTGRIGESLDLVERQAQRRPLGREDSRQLQQWLNQAGRPDEAEREYARSFDLPGDRSATELTALMRTLGTGDRESVEQAFSRYLDTEWSRPGDRALSAVLDSPNEALELLRSQIENALNPEAMPPHLAAAWASYFGDHELAIRSLRASPETLFKVSVMLWEPVFAGTRRRDSFETLLRDFGYVDYWHSVGAWGDFCRPVDVDGFECR